VKEEETNERERQGSFGSKPASLRTRPARCKFLPFGCLHELLGQSGVLAMYNESV
jgi:hypothetical protein